MKRIRRGIRALTQEQLERFIDKMKFYCYSYTWADHALWAWKVFKVKLTPRQCRNAFDKYVVNA